MSNLGRIHCHTTSECLDMYFKYFSGTEMLSADNPSFTNAGVVLLLLNLKTPELDVEGLTKLLHAKDCVLLVLIIRVWLLKQGHLGAEEFVVGARPLEHHKSLVGLAHLAGSRDFFSKYRDYLVTFKYSMSPPSSWQIRQVMSSALVKCRNTQIPQVVRSSRSHLATAPMAKWSAQMQLFTPTLVSRSELRSYSSNLWIFF